MSTTRWTESVSGYDAVDEDAGVIRGVKVIGVSSRNRRRYKEAALVEAIPMYEGSRVYIDHVRPDKSGSGERSVRDKWGELQNVRAIEGGLAADLHYLKTHPMSPMLIESARRFPKSFGLSHDANGEETTTSGVREVVRINRVNSVDVVNDPASNKGLFESTEPTMKFREIAANRSKFAKILEEMIGQDPAMGEMPVPMPEPEMEDGGASPEEQVEIAFKAALVAVLDDASLDVPGKLAKIKSILNAQAAATEAIGGGKPDDESTETPADYGKTEEEGTQESMSSTEVGALREELATLKAESARNKLVASVTKMLTESKREVTDVRVKALVALQESDRKSLVESWPVLKPAAGRPATSPSVLSESASGAPVEYPKSVEDFKRSLGG